MNILAAFLDSFAVASYLHLPRPSTLFFFLSPYPFFLAHYIPILSYISSRHLMCLNPRSQDLQCTC